MPHDNVVAPISDPYTASDDAEVDVVDESEETSEKEESDEEVIAEARKRFAIAEEAYNDIRKEALEDLRFRAGEQWPDEIKSARGREKRPCLVVNKIGQSVNQIVNDQRQNKPSIKISPVDDKADVETAKVFQGLIRHIDYNSNASVARDTAFQSAATGGFGYYRVITDFVDSLSFDQEILIKRIRNPLSVYFDPHSKELDGSDANWGFVVEDIPKDEYLALYKKSKLAASGAWTSLGNSAPDWISEDSCRVAEYFYKKFELKEIAQLSTGEIVLAQDLPEVLPAGVEVVQKRTAPVPAIKWCKLNGFEILEKTDWPGKYIPIIPVYGQELDIDGKLTLEGVVRQARDPARMYNYWVSAETEAIALAPRAPFIAAEGQTEGYEEDWKTANSRNHAVLKYKPISVGGQPVAPPQRNSFEPAIQAISQARMLAADDIKATTGIYDAALGARSNETSGVAIQRRNNQAQTSNFHLTDNLSASIRHEGRILIDLIPKIYDTARMARIIGEEGEEDLVPLNQKFVKKGKTVIHDLNVGKYDATVDLGPSFATKRQEAVASMTEFTRAMPQTAALIADLMVKNSDWPGASEIAERLKKALPPGIAEDPKGEKKAIPPEVQAQMQQMSQMVEQLTGRVKDLQTEKEQKLIELESRERIEMKKLEVQLEIERAKLDAKDGLALLNHEISQINQRLSLLNIDQPIEYEDESMNSALAQSDGAPMRAPVAEEPFNPTGGESPGQSIEGMNPDVY